MPTLKSAAAPRSMILNVRESVSVFTVGGAISTSRKHKEILAMIGC